MEEERGVWVGAALATIALGAAVYYFYIREDAPPPPAPVRAPAPTASASVAPPEILNPLPPPPPDEAAAPLPPLAQSDPDVRDSLTRLFGGEAVEKLVVPDGLVRKFVVTVDDLARKKASVQSRPVAATPGTFRVAGTEDSPTLDPQNYARYTPVVTLVQRAETAQLARLYLRFYPLFQEAYADLGREGAYFNDRVVEVIDHLLATPDVQGPIALVQPRVFYQFADPQLEALSAGQKLLIRMGPENAGIIKQKLTELRAQIAAQRSP
ncbi:MAG: DUF3014 domain-containing protein [Gammaproteobacteria bacterium]